MMLRAGFPANVIARSDQGRIKSYCACGCMCSILIYVYELVIPVIKLPESIIVFQQADRFDQQVAEIQRIGLTQPLPHRLRKFSRRVSLGSVAALYQSCGVSSWLLPWLIRDNAAGSHGSVDQGAVPRNSSARTDHHHGGSSGIGG